MPNLGPKCRTGRLCALPRACLEIRRVPLLLIGSKASCCLSFIFLPFLDHSAFPPSSSLSPHWSSLPRFHQNHIPSGVVSLCTRGKEAQQSQSQQACVVTPPPYRHNTACSLFSAECPQTSSARFKRGGHPEKKIHFNKDLPLPG